MSIVTYISIVILSLSALKVPSEDRLPEWVQKQEQYTCCLQYLKFRSKNIYVLTVKGWKQLFWEKGNKK